MVKEVAGQPTKNLSATSQPSTNQWFMQDWQFELRVRYESKDFWSNIITAPYNRNYGLTLR